MYEYFMCMFSCNHYFAFENDYSFILDGVEWRFAHSEENSNCDVRDKSVVLHSRLVSAVYVDFVKTGTVEIRDGPETVDVNRVWIKLAAPPNTHFVSGDVADPPGLDVPHWHTWETWKLKPGPNEHFFLDFDGKWFDRLGTWMITPSSIYFLSGDVTNPPGSGVPDIDDFHHWNTS